MTVETNPITLFSKIGTPPEPLQFADRTTVQSALEGEKTPLDLVELSFLTEKGDDVPTRYVGKQYAYSESTSVFMSETKIEYNGENGSSFSIHYSYKALSRKVHYEMINNAKIVGESPEINRHPLGESYGPNKTADRILNFAKSLVNQFMAREGEDPEKLEAFIRKLIKAINNGFVAARNILGVVPPDVGSMIRETYDKVMSGMSNLNEEHSGEQETVQSRFIYEEEISFVSESVEISVMA